MPHKNKISQSLLKAIFATIFALFITMPHLVQAQTYQAKKAGMCFRFDDYQKPENLERVRVLFNKYGVKFTYSLNTGLGEIFGDTAFWSVVRRMEADGHEIADQTPNDVSHYFESKTTAEAQNYAGRPGVDHVNATFNRVCLKYQVLSTTGAGDEGKVDVSGNRIISKTAGEFAWNRLINLRYTSHLYLPVNGKLFTLYDIRNGNSNDPDTIYVKSFWKEDIDLGTYSNVDFRKLTPFDLSIEKEGLQTMLGYSFKVFANNGLKNPVTFIHPGGSHPYLTRKLLKEALEPFGIKGGASYPYAKFGLTYYNPDGLNQFALQGGDITPEMNSLEDCKKHIAEYYAKNTVIVSINHFTSLGAAYSFDQMLVNLEQLIIWCKANNIPMQTYATWNKYFSEDYMDQTDDVFPPLQNDFDNDGKTDGLLINNANIIDKINGLPYNNNVCYTVSTNTFVFNFTRVYALSRGKNTLSLSTKGGKDQYDYFSMVLDMPEINYSKTYAVYTNTVNYTERNFDFEVPNGVTYFNLTLNYNTQNNQKVFVSGIKLKSQKKPSFRTLVITREAHQAFPSLDLSNYAACNGFGQSQLVFKILAQPKNLNASLSANKNLILLPKNNRFWVGKDSIRVSVMAPDNTADTTWFHIESFAAKSCRDQWVDISVNVDTVSDASYAWGANPTDASLVSGNASIVRVRPTVNTTYSNTITFKNTTTRTDVVPLNVISSRVFYGPYEEKYFGTSSTITSLLNYPNHYKVYVKEYPQGGGTVALNGKQVSITKPAGFSGILETEFFVTTPTCDAIVHTIAASTFKTALSEFGSNQNISCYPNPFTDKLTVEGLPAGNCEMELYDLCGKLVYQSQILVQGKIAEIDLMGLSNGFYVLKMASENQVFAKKILKN
ncbi:MAG: T9SS type A sorting domain-containing protein [bacterium]|nr:T9SS type A sorting domain-containing protein [bacterium]